MSAMRALLSLLLLCAVATAAEPPGDEASWMETRERVALVMAVVTGRTSLDQACCEHGIPHRELARWVSDFLEAGADAIHAEVKATAKPRASRDKQGLELRRGPGRQGQVKRIE